MKRVAPVRTATRPSRAPVRSVHWPRIFAEAVSIVASILLAFAIDAWWDARKANRDTDQLLASLHAEFTANRRALIAHINRIRLTLVSGYRLEAWSAGDGAPVPPDSLAALLAPVLFPATLDPGAGVIIEALNSGKINNITNSDLRVALARWPGQLEEATDHEAGVDVLINERFRPLLNRLMLLPPVRRGFANAPIENFWRDPVAIHREFVSGALRTREFRNEVNTLLDWTVASLGDKRPFLDYVDQVLDLLESDLQARGLQVPAATRTSVPAAPEILASAYRQALGERNAQ